MCGFFLFVCVYVLYFIWLFCVCVWYVFGFFWFWEVCFLKEFQELEPMPLSVGLVGTEV